MPVNTQMPDASAVLAMLPAARIAAARFVGADPMIVAKKMAINKMLAAEEEIAPEAIAAAAPLGADPKIVARKQAINKMLREQEMHGWR